MRLARALPGAPHFSHRSPPPGRSKKAIPPDLPKLCKDELGGELPIFTRSGAFCHDNAIAAMALDAATKGMVLWYILIVGLCDLCDAGFFDGEASATGRCVMRTLRYHLLAGLPDALPLATSANEFAFGACRQHMNPSKHCCEVTGVTAQKAQCVTDGGPRDPLPASTTAAG